MLQALQRALEKAEGMEMQHIRDKKVRSHA
jgi:hypothetical protein